MIEGMRSQGHAYWRPFSAAPDQMIWYQQAVLNMLWETWRHAVLHEHSRVLADFLAATRAGLPRTSPLKTED